MTLDEIIDRLKAELGPVADFTTEAVTRQILVGGIVNVLLLVLASIVLFVLLRRTLPWALAEREKANSYDRGTWTMGISMFSLLVGGNLILMLMWNTLSLIQRIVNPAWVAIELLRGLF